MQTECEFVVIKVKELAEAFQMFESQNGRGKDLEAYNLLKAYHIRAMENDSQSEKLNVTVDGSQQQRHSLALGILLIC